MKKFMKKFSAWLSKVWEDMKEQPLAYAVCGTIMAACITVCVLCMTGVLSKYIFWNIFWGTMLFYAGDCFGHMVSKK